MAQFVNTRLKKAYICHNAEVGQPSSENGYATRRLLVRLRRLLGRVKQINVVLLIQLPLSSRGCDFTNVVTRGPKWEEGNQYDV